MSHVSFQTIFLFWWQLRQWNTSVVYKTLLDSSHDSQAETDYRFWKYTTKLETLKNINQSWFFLFFCLYIQKESTVFKINIYFVNVLLESYSLYCLVDCESALLSRRVFSQFNMNFPWNWDCSSLRKDNWPSLTFSTFNFT